MLLELVTAVGGIALLMALWFAVQGFLRRRTGAGADTDVLQAMADGCGCCDQHSCAAAPPKPKLISLTLKPRRPQS